MNSKWLLLSMLILAGCTSSSLTEQEKAKLDAELQKLIGGEAIIERQYDVSNRPGGEKEYGVIIRS